MTRFWIDLRLCSPVAMNVLTRIGVSTMNLETKFLRLRTPVTLGSRFGEWQVIWLGGWTRHHLNYLVMVMRKTNATEHKVETSGSEKSRRV